MAYDKNVNYQQKINEAVARGDYASAAAYEKQRNEKIDGEGLSQYTKTNNYVIPKGMSGEQYNKVNSTFKVGDKYNNYQAQADTNLNKYQTHADSDMISSGTKSKLNTSFNMPNSVKQADRWLANQLDIIQSGKTSYTDQVRDMMDKIMNREKFSYDVDNDTMFQQALSSAMKSGQAAMQNTIGQASALTGGYGSTYATTAGNQAYNSFIEDAYNNLPEYYQMALDAYNSEGENMFRQYGMLSEADEKEYNRNIAAYDATYQHRNQMYNEAYGRFRDERSDAFAMADLEMREYTQRGNDIYNLYAMYADEADKEYQRQYQTWHDDVTMAFEMGKLGQSDYWNQYGYDFEATQNQLNREHETSERLGRQEFETSEREASQDFTTQRDKTLFENDKYLQDDAQDFTKGEREASQEFTTQRDEILQGYTDKNMATEHGYNKEILGIEQGNKKELMDIEQGYTDKNMATQHGYDVAMEGIRHDNDMEKINTQNDFQADENQKDRDWKSGESQKDRDLTVSENAKDRSQDNAQFNAKLTADKSSGSNKGGTKTPTKTMYSDALKAFNTGDLNAYYAERDAAAVAGYDVSLIDDYVANHGDDWVDQYNNYKNGIKIKTDTKNGAGGEDHNDVYEYTSPENGKTYVRTYDQLKKKIQSSNMPKEKQEELLAMLRKQSKK